MNVQIITCFEIIWPITLFRYQWTQGDPYWEAVNLSFTFTRGDGKTEDITKVSTLPLLKDYWLNNIGARDIYHEQNAWQCERDLK